MNRVLPMVVVALVVFGLAGSGSVALADPDGHGDVMPGERLSGIIGVQDAELQGDLAERAFGIKVAQAATDDARADVVHIQLVDVEERLDHLEERMEELEAAREAGEITEGQYQARMARIAAEQATLERLTTQSEATVGELPAELLRDKGINVTAIETLKERASELGGPEIREIARSIAGPETGQAIAEDARERGPPDHAVDPHDDVDPDNVTLEDVNASIDAANDAVQDAQATLNATEQALNATESPDNDTEARLAEANQTLQDATAALEEAKELRDAGDLEAAYEQAQTAIALADDAKSIAETVLEQLDDPEDADDMNDTPA